MRITGSKQSEIKASEGMFFTVHCYLIFLFPCLTRDHFSRHPEISDASKKIVTINRVLHL